MAADPIKRPDRSSQSSKVEMLWPLLLTAFWNIYLRAITLRIRLSRFRLTCTTMITKTYCGFDMLYEWRSHLHRSMSPPKHNDDVMKWKHFPRYWPFVRGIHQSPVNSPHKGQWRGAVPFSLICASIKYWVNNCKAGDLKRHGAHYDVTAMHQT